MFFFIFIFIKKISANLLNTVIVCSLSVNYSHPLLQLKLTDFVNNFCFQKTFSSPPISALIVPSHPLIYPESEDGREYSSRKLLSHTVKQEARSQEIKQSSPTTQWIRTVSAFLPLHSLNLCIHSISLYCLFFPLADLHFRSAVTSAQTAWISPASIIVRAATSVATHESTNGAASKAGRAV